ncbi:MAG TPA: type II secretion system secretin GspD [Xanthobacteraceae bacterium]
MSRILLQVCVAAAICDSLLGCAVKDNYSFPASDIVDTIRNADLGARSPAAERPSGTANQAARPLLVPGADADAAVPGSRQADAAPRIQASAPGVVASAAGIEFNFEGADIATVAKSLIGDTLGLAFVVDPRVQGTVTFASTGPIARKDVLPIFESILRMSSAALVREANLVKIVPIPEAAGAGAMSAGTGQPGFGVSVVPLRYTSAASVARMAENFLSRPGAIRADQARNLLLVQGTSVERQSALDVIATFDVEWLRNQSVGVYPLKSTTPETMISELEKLFQAGENGQGQGAVQFQGISRMNAVMVVAKSARTLDRVTQWVRRLDRSDTTGNALRTYKLRYGNAQQVAKILSDIFVGRTGTSAESPAGQLAPGVASTQSRLDSLGSGSLGASNANAGASASGANQGVSVGGNTGRAGGSAAADFEGFAGQRGGDNDNGTAGLPSGSIGRGVFQNVRITADTSANAIVIYSNQEDFRAIERALRDIDRPRLQVAIDATVAEVTLTDQLQYGVQHFFTSADVGMAGDKGSVGMFPAAAPTTTSSATSTSTAAAVAQTVQAAFLQRVLPGFNLLLGPEAQPRVILSALSTITDVKVLSSPSLVVIDNQPAALEVGNQIPVTTSTATLLSNSNTPVVNTIEMRSTGVILKVLPRVHANGLVQLEIEQEISNVVNPNQQTLTPTISQRRIHSTVAVTSGQTVLLGGLISEQQDNSKDGIPGLNQIKYLGDLLGNTSRSRQRSEIIVFIRPQVVRDGVDQQAVTQEFRERLESMRAPREFIEGKDASPVPRPAAGRRN